jgi:lipoate-protein ligase A
VFYQLICKKTDYQQNLREFYEYFLTPTVTTYNYFGIAAKYSPINDIVANGRKISGNGTVTYEKSRILVGNLIFSFPSKEMSEILKVPEEKFRDKVASSLEERMGSFSHFLDKTPSKNDVVENYLDNFQEDLQIKLVEGSITFEEQNKLQEIMQLYQEEDWLYYVEKDRRDLFQQKIKGDTYFTHTDRKFPGGLLQLFIHFDEGKIAEIIISGDFSLSPPDILEDLQASLIGLEVGISEIEKVLREFFKSRSVDLPGIEISEIAQLIVETYQRIRK